jgi:hypothetical protein
MKKGNIGEACSTQGRDVKGEKRLVTKSEGKRSLGKECVDRLILKRILQKQNQ